jgi:hypothetical protein
MDLREQMMKRLDHLNDIWMTSALPGVGPGIDTWKRWTLNYPFDVVCEAIPLLGKWYRAEAELGHKKTLRDCIAYGGGLDEERKGIMNKLTQQREGREKVRLHQARLRAKVVDPQEKFLNEEIEDRSYLDGETEFLDDDVVMVPITAEELD